MPFQLPEGLQVMQRGEDVYLWKRRLHTTTERLIARIAQQRVTPYQLSCAPFQIRKCPGEFIRLSGIPPITQYNDNRTLINQAGPIGIEVSDAPSDKCAAGPASDIGRQSLQDSLKGSLLQVCGYSFNRGAEDECFHPRETVLQAVNKLKKDAAVEVHRTR